MKRKTLSINRNSRDELGITDTHLNFDANDLALLDQKALAESFESIRQAPPAATLGPKISKQIKKETEKKLKPIDNSALPSNTKDNHVLGNQLYKDRFRHVAETRTNLTDNNDVSSVNKISTTTSQLEKKARQFLESKNVLPIKNNNVDQNIASNASKIANVIKAAELSDIATPSSILQYKKESQTEVVVDEIEESDEYGGLTDRALIDEQINYLSDKHLDSHWEEDDTEDYSNELDDSLEFLVEADLGEIIDASDSSFLGQLNANSDELVSVLQRAKQAANQVTQEFELPTKSFEWLCDIFMQNGWGPCRTAITKQLNDGRSIKEIWTAHQIREIWRDMQDTWALGNNKNSAAKFDERRMKQKKLNNAREGLIELDRLIYAADFLYYDERPAKKRLLRQLKSPNLATVKKSIPTNMMAWTLALRLVDFLDIQAVDSDFVTEFICYMHEGWLNQVKNYQWPIRFEMYLHHKLYHMPASWREPASLPNEELWWNDKPSYSADPFQLDYLMGRCCGDKSYDYIDIKRVFDEL
jgi:hypothetical protein